MFKKIKKLAERQNNLDLIKDRQYYDEMAEKIENLDSEELIHYFNAINSESLFNHVYEQFYGEIKNLITDKNYKVLEIGAGFGRHTVQIVKYSNNVLILDVSSKALELNLKMNKSVQKAIVSSMSSIPLDNSSIDLIICGESLSYADPKTTDSEILRVLKPGGSLIIIDALNHNPIYKINRWMKFILGLRSLSSVYRIPKLSRISRLAENFQNNRIIFFGTWVWLIKIIGHLVKRSKAKYFSELLDQYVKNKYAFKFILVAENYIIKERNKEISF
jgi:ubiquinone/menaquinone biosynthesis C-methylase UbiE